MRHTIWQAAIFCKLPPAVNKFSFHFRFAGLDLFHERANSSHSFGRALRRGPRHRVSRRDERRRTKTIRLGKETHEPSTFEHRLCGRPTYSRETHLPGPRRFAAAQMVRRAAL